MSAPIINKISTFDVNNGVTIHFSYTGKQPYWNSIKIYDTDNFSTPVYEDETPIKSMTLYRTLRKSNELFNVINGKQYAVCIKLYDNNYEESEISPYSRFWCFSTPDFYFINDGIKTGNVNVKAASYNANIYYKQNEDSQLASYKYFLYNSSNELIHESNTFYNSDNYIYSVKGLDSGTGYKLICSGTTDKGIQVVAEVNLSVKYKKPSGKYARIFTKLKNGSNSLYQDCDNSDGKYGSDGIVDYITNLIVINGEDEDYEFDDSFINLENKPLIYRKNFKITGDIEVAIKHKYHVGSELLKMIDTTGGYVELFLIETDDDRYRYLLKVHDGLTYVLFSDPFDFTFFDIATCWIRRINNVYQLKVFVEKDMSMYFNLWLGLNDPPDETGEDIEKYDVWIDTDNVPTVYIDKDVVDIKITDIEPTEDDIELYDIWIGGDTE